MLPRLAILALGPLALGNVTAQPADHDRPAHASAPNQPSATPTGGEPTGDLLEVAAGAGDFTMLAAALEAAGLVEALQGDGPFTLLAPTDAAFALLPSGVVEMLLLPENAELLSSVLTYHVVPGRVLAAQAAGAGEAQTLGGAAVTFGIDAGRLVVNGANVVATDVPATNGVIHVIDAVLLPPDFVLPDAMAANPQAAARELIDLAIRRGVPLYNRGDHEACAAVYEVALEGLIAHPALAEPGRDTAAAALEEGRAMRDMDARAWAFRRGLDAVRAQVMQSP